ncbi:hypothetical protein MTO96_019144 [Rhipicephalus appendiculatus]
MRIPNVAGVGSGMPQVHYYRTVSVSNRRFVIHWHTLRHGSQTSLHTAHPWSSPRLQVKTEAARLQRFGKAGGHYGPLRKACLSERHVHTQFGNPLTFLRHTLEDIQTGTWTLRLRTPRDVWDPADRPEDFDLFRSGCSADRVAALSRAF